MAGKWLVTGCATLLLLAAGCAPKRAAAPPPPPAKQSVIVLLVQPEGKPSGIVVKNAAGAQELSQPYQAVRVERADLAPSPPFAMDQAEVRRLFGAELDILPSPEVLFVLYFDEGRDVLVTESEAQIPLILKAIQDHHSTTISVTGHTDTVGESQANYDLGLRRAQRVRDILQAQGVAGSDLFVESHGATDLLVKTPAGVEEPRNRRVEVIVR